MKAQRRIGGNHELRRGGSAGFRIRLNFLCGDSRCVKDDFLRIPQAVSHQLAAVTSVPR